MMFCSEVVTAQVNPFSFQAWITGFDKEVERVLVSTHSGDSQLMIFSFLECQTPNFHTAHNSAAGIFARACSEIKDKFQEVT